MAHEKEIDFGRSDRLILFAIPLFIILAFQLAKNPARILIYSFVYPVVSLPIYVLFGYELGVLNISLEILSIVALVFLFAKDNSGTNINGYLTIFIMLSLLSVYGFLQSISSIPLTVAFLGIKMLFFPFILALVASFDGEFRSRLVSSLFYVQIINSIAVVAETTLGIDRLESLGLEYGTNLRNFDSYLRAPGLALTNYILGSFSASILFLAYLVLTHQFVLNKGISKRLCVLSGIGSIICLVLSNFRSGILFSVLAILLCEIISRRKFLGASLALSLGTVVFLLAILSEFFLLDSNSFGARQTKWADLLSSYDWKMGSGIGFTGAASRSSFAPVGSLVVTDNQFVSMLLQFGLFGLLCSVFILLYLFAKGSPVSKSLVIALAAMMLFVEAWDFTLFFSIVLYLIYDGIRVQRNQFPV